MPELEEIFSGHIHANGFVLDLLIEDDEYNPEESAQIAPISPQDESTQEDAPVENQDDENPVVYIGDDGALIVEEHKRPTEDDPSEEHAVTVVGKKEPFWGQTWSLEEGGKEYRIPELAEFAKESAKLMFVPVDELSKLMQDSESDEHDRSPAFVERAEECDLSHPLLIWHKDGVTKIIDGRHRIRKARNHDIVELPAYVMDSLPDEEETKPVGYAGKKLPGGHIDDIEGAKPLK
jgi:hypothetical protein